MLETLYGTGIRRSELVGLEVCHLDLEDRSLRVQQAKRGTSRPPDRAILSLFYDVGLSPRQAAALEERNLHDGRLCCPGAEDLLLEPELAARLERWRSVRPELLRDPAEPALFIGHTGRALGSQRLSGIVRDAGDLAGLGPGVSPRLLRRSSLEHERDFGLRRHPF